MTFNDAKGNSISISNNGVSFSTPNGLSGSIGNGSWSLDMPGISTNGDSSGNLSVTISIWVISTTLNSNGSYSSTLDAGALTINTSGPALGEVTSGSISIDIGVASFTDKFYIDENGHMIEESTIQLPGQNPQTTTNNLSTPEGVANSWAGRLVNDITGGLVDKIRDYYKKQQLAIDGEAIIDPNTKTYFDRAKSWQPRPLDPLTLDLDGDGIETVGASSSKPILFDHDGDGTKHGTGWIKADDGMLVLDRNGNGNIDNGRELFGDSTIKSNGLKATDGFDALADIDSNHDGKISNSDAQFADLRIWRDLNQDGISQTAELYTLASLNIASINVASTDHSKTLANGNQIADLGSFTKTDGSTGTVGEVTGNLADINLADDTFHRQFGNVLDTSTVANLPDMQGSGAVRDLREAANGGDWRVVA